MSIRQHDHEDLPDFSRRNLLKLAGMAMTIGSLGVLAPERAFAAGNTTLVLYYSKNRPY
ncbi:MAG TPA: hypothetical protein H9962_06150 [Candidatus Mailhella merdigallinarum]|uniref:Uncharacterized protein n=1 Tax=Candidatus Mailhella merdigallinarum TaxID=2838658 RepID=A0A9D2HEK8_9BACT|nr:hypothetical protein [Candidatus Mailhella merdigallinarum]